jgi:hypothetical protein
LCHNAILLRPKFYALRLATHRGGQALSKLWTLQSSSAGINDPGDNAIALSDLRALTLA